VPVWRTDSQNGVLLMSDPTDIVERLNEGVITNGSGYLYAGVNESATGYLMELAADEIVKLRLREW
jgi:ATP-dependent protease HslVU (ClpYQ) peptidase subunit